MMQSEKLEKKLIDTAAPKTPETDTCCVRFFNAVSNVPKHLAKAISGVDLNSMR